MLIGNYIIYINIKMIGDICISRTNLKVDCKVALW